MGDLQLAFNQTFHLRPRTQITTCWRKSSNNPTVLDIQRDICEDASSVIDHFVISLPTLLIVTFANSTQSIIASSNDDSVTLEEWMDTDLSIGKSNSPGELTEFQAMREKVQRMELNYENGEVLEGPIQEGERWNCPAILTIPQLGPSRTIGAVEPLAVYQVVGRVHSVPGHYTSRLTPDGLNVYEHDGMVRHGNAQLLGGTINQELGGAIPGTYFVAYMLVTVPSIAATKTRYIPDEDASIQGKKALFSKYHSHRSAVVTRSRDVEIVDFEAERNLRLHLRSVKPTFIKLNHTSEDQPWFPTRALQRLHRLEDEYEFKKGFQPGQLRVSSTGFPIGSVGKRFGSNADEVDQTMEEDEDTDVSLRFACRITEPDTWHTGRTICMAKVVRVRLKMESIQNLLPVLVRFLQRNTRVLQRFQQCQLRCHHHNQQHLLISPAHLHSCLLPSVTRFQTQILVRTQSTLSAVPP
jgi:hypothetical protein